MRIALVTMLVSAACIAQIVRVTVRDPSQLAIRVHGAPILEMGAARGEVPSSAFLVRPLDDAQVTRDGPAIDVWCPHCDRWKRRSIVTGCSDSELVDSIATCVARDPPMIELDGTIAQTIQRDGDLVHLRYRFIDRPGPSRSEQERRIELDVVTPAANVSSIVHCRDVGKRRTEWECDPSVR